MGSPGVRLPPPSPPPTHHPQLTHPRPAQPDKTITHTYPPNHKHEEGRIAVILHVALDATKCPGPIMISRDGCWDALHYALDTCDMAGENRKHGGIVWNMDGCVYMVLDPNPGVNAPYEGLLGP